MKKPPLIPAVLLLAIASSQAAPTVINLGLYREHTTSSSDLGTVSASSGLSAGTGGASQATTYTISGLTLDANGTADDSITVTLNLTAASPGATRTVEGIGSNSQRWGVRTTVDSSANRSKINGDESLAFAYGGAIVTLGAGGNEVGTATFNGFTGFTMFGAGSSDTYSISGTASNNATDVDADNSGGGTSVISVDGSGFAYSFTGLEDAFTVVNGTGELRCANVGLRLTIDTEIAAPAPLMITAGGFEISALVSNNTFVDASGSLALDSANSIGQTFYLKRATELTDIVLNVASQISNGTVLLEIYQADLFGLPTGDPLFSESADLPSGFATGEAMSLSFDEALDLAAGFYAFTLSTSDADLSIETNLYYGFSDLLRNNSGTGMAWSGPATAKEDLAFDLVGTMDRAPASTGPNIIHILVDDMSYTDHSVANLVVNPGELSDFIETPNIEALAATGLSFRWSYTQPNCAPSRAAFMTGQYACRSGNGVYNVTGLKRQSNSKNPGLIGASQGINDGDNSDAEDNINGSEGTAPLGVSMQDLGYYTFHLGKYHIGEREPSHPTFATNHGIDVMVGLGGKPDKFFVKDDGTFGDKVGSDFDPYSADYTQAYVDAHLAPFANGNNPNTVVGTRKHYTDAMVDAFEDKLMTHWTGPNQAYPVYVQMHFNATHAPTNPRSDIEDKYDAKKADPATAPSVDTKANFAAFAEQMDQSVGRIMRLIYDPNLDGDTSDSIAANTLIVWTTDNGGKENDTENFPLRGEKGMHLEGGIRVPTILSMPGTIPANTISDSLVHTIDFYPTFLDFAQGAAGSPHPNAATHMLDGESLYAHSLNPASVARDRSPIFYHFPGYMDSRAYASSLVIKEVGGKRFKYIYNYDPYYGSVGTYGGAPDQYQLYNLSDDPYESINLMDYIDVENVSDSNDPSDSREYWDYLLHKDTADEMAADLNAWLTQPGDDWEPLFPTYKTEYPDGPTRNGAADGAQVAPPPASTPDVELVPAPEGFSFKTLMPIDQGGGDLQFTFDSHTGFTYQVQASNTLAPDSWGDVGLPVVASGGSTQIIVNDPVFETEDKRFYRIVLID